MSYKKRKEHNTKRLHITWKKKREKRKKPKKATTPFEKEKDKRYGFI